MSVHFVIDSCCTLFVYSGGFYFNEIITYQKIQNDIALILQDQPERSVKILAKMKLLKILPDIRTYELLFSLFGNVNAPYEDGNILSQVDAAKRIKAIEMDMAKNGVQHSHSSMKNLVTPSLIIMFLLICTELTAYRKIELWVIY